MVVVPGNQITGSGGYGSYPGNLYRDRYDWIIMPDEAPHMAVSGVIGLLTKNPLVSVGVAAAHGYWHLLTYAIAHADHDHSSPSLPGGGGPGIGTPTSTERSSAPPSLAGMGRLVAGVPVGGGSSGSLGSRRRRGRRRRYRY